MPLQPLNIFGFKSGKQNNKKPFLLIDDAFPTLENAYVWREQVKKKEGLRFLGRLRRSLTAQSSSTTTPGAGTTVTISNVFTDIGISGESNAEIDPGSLVITVGAPDTATFTDNGNGGFAVTGAGVAAGSSVHYGTGEVVLKFTSLTGGAAITLNIDYFPGLPCMGISEREDSEISVEQYIFFDTKYAYVYASTRFEEFITGTTWSGTDTDFFWTTNYRGSDAQTRLFFETNNVNSSTSPMRYTNGTTWTDFTPIVDGTSTTEILSTTLASGSATFNDTLGTVPIIEGTLVITVEASGQPTLTFRDRAKDGNLTSSGNNDGTIVYSTGAIQLNFDPVLAGGSNFTVTAVYDVPNNLLLTSLILVPYYGRLVALNTTEGTTLGGAGANIFNRARFSQVGSPIQQDAWRSDVFGKGGFIDAPTNESITSARFYKNMLIVQFEQSTWRLQYIGEYGTPFIWERISSDFGSESTFSTILFDDGVLAVGDKAIVASSGTDVQRIDLEIPDLVYDFRNESGGTKRIQAARNFQKELVYWSYVDASSTESTYPNKILLFNYRNNTFATLRANITAMGPFQLTEGITWDSLDTYWDPGSMSWDTFLQSHSPVIAAGNQSGFVSILGEDNANTSASSQVNLNEQETLSIQDITIASANGPVTLTIPNHNLEADEFIYVSYLKFWDDTVPEAGSNDIEDQIYLVSITDSNNVVLYKWNSETNQAYNNFPVTTVGDYAGGGVAALLPKVNFITKDLNPFKQVGQNIFSSYIDFLFDATPNSQVSIYLNINTKGGYISNQPGIVGQLQIGNTAVETSQTEQGYIAGITLGNPTIIESPNHGLLDGAEITIDQVVGTTDLNGNFYDVTFIDVNTFSIDVDSTAFDAWIRGGYWSQSNQGYYTLGSSYAWHRFDSQAYGQFIAIQVTYSNDQMILKPIHQQDFVLNGLQMWYREAGRNVFGSP